MRWLNGQTGAQLSDGREFESSVGKNQKVFLNNIFTFGNMKKLIKKLYKIPEISGKNIFKFFFKYLLTIILL